MNYTTVHEGNPLVGVIRPLNPKSKCAMFAAARAGTIARRTWNGCAWNAASKEEGGNVNDSLAAGKLFGVTPSLVDRFIAVWDSLPGTDETCTRLLIEAIEEVGLFTEPNVSRTTRIVREYAYKSQATKFKEQLESGELTVDQIPGAQEISLMLSAV